MYPEIAQRLEGMIDPPNPTERKQININCSVRDDARLAAIFPDIDTSAERLTALIRLVIPEWDGNFSPPYEIIGPEYAIAQANGGNGRDVLQRWQTHMLATYDHHVKLRSLQTGVYRWMRRNYPGKSPREIADELQK